MSLLPNRRILTLLALALSAGPALAQTCIPAPPGLVAWWRGQGDATDTAGGNDGALQGGASFSAAEVGLGFTFDSDDDRVVIPHAANLNLTAPGWTAEFWMRGIKNQPQTDFAVFEKSHAGGTGWAFQGNNTSGILRLAIGNGGFPEITTTSDVLDGVFHHVAGTWDGTTVRLYLDGVLHSQTTVTTPMGNTRDLNVGFWWGGGSPARFFRGIADDLSIYNRALGQAEIQAIVASGAGGKCVPHCVNADGAVDVGEQCDDGNATDGDGCSALCQIEQCYECSGSPSSCTPQTGSACDDGVFCNGADTCASGACTVHAGDPCVGTPSCSNLCNEADDSCNAPLGTACTSDGDTCTADECDGAGACVHTSNHTCPCLDPAAGLVGFWRGEGDATDSVGGDDGTLQGGASLVLAKVGLGFAFDSDDDRVVIPDAANLDIGPSGFTAEFWMKGIKNQPQSLFTVFEKSHGFGAGWAFQGDSTTGDLGFVAGDGSGFPGVGSAVDVLDGSFHHVAGTWDGSTMRLYVDGVLQGTAPLATPTGNTLPVNVGFWWGAGSPARFFRGVADELSIYDRALSHAEIQAVIAAGIDGKCVPQCVSSDGMIELGEQCDDGNLTSGDGCSATCRIETCYTCSGEPSVCTPANGASCDDGIFCNGADTCSGGVCVHPGNPCTGGPVCNSVCNEAADNCFVAAGTACTSDGNVCTDDLCDGAGACAHTNNTASCDDGLFCNGADTCSGGTCTHAGNPCTGGPECANVCNEAADDCFVASGTPCTSDGNPCTHDQCDGSGACAHAPGNPGVVCRASAGQCDVAETCTGVTSTCPPDQFQPDDTPCDDGEVCTTNDTCQGGVCTPGAGVVCPTCKTCSSGVGCVDDPPATTFVPLKGGVLIKDSPNDKGDKVTFKWTGADFVPLANYGDPLNTSNYELCVYDTAGGVPSVALGMRIPAGQTCAGKPCWISTTTGYKYKDKDLTPDGASTVLLKSGLVLGAAKITVKGKGLNLLTPSLPLAVDPVVKVRLRRRDSLDCWGIDVTAPKVNTTLQFKQ